MRLLEPRGRGRASAPDPLVELLVAHGHAQRGAAQAERAGEVGERAAQRGPQVVAADQVDRERLQQLHAARAPRRGGAGVAEAAHVVREQERRSGRRSTKAEMLASDSMRNE